MTRKNWVWLVVALTATALAATFAFAPTLAPPPPAGPVPTPFGWNAQLGLASGDGQQGLREGLALQARYADPYGIAVAGDGTRYVADAGDNNRIRIIHLDGTVATLAGSVEGFIDGSGSAAAFNTPSGLSLIHI